MSRWSSPKLQSSKKKKKQSSDWSKSGRPSTSKLTTRVYTEDESDCLVCTPNDSDCLVCTSGSNYLNCNDLGPKCWDGSTDIYLKYTASDKGCQTNVTEDGERRANKTPTKSSSDKIAAEVESNEELSDASKYLLCRYIFKDIIGADLVYMGPFGKNLGRYSQLVEKCV